MTNLALARSLVEKMRHLSFKDALEVVALQAEIVCRCSKETNARRRQFDEKIALCRAVPQHLKRWPK